MFRTEHFSGYIWKFHSISNSYGFEILIVETWNKHKGFQLKTYFEILRLIIMHLVLVLNFVHCICRNILWNGIIKILKLLMRIEWWRIVSSSATDAFFSSHNFQTNDRFLPKKDLKGFQSKWLHKIWQIHNNLMTAWQLPHDSLT